MRDFLENVYKKMFIQIWIFVVCLFVFIAATVLLADLKKCEVSISNGYEGISFITIDSVNYVNFSAGSGVQVEYIGIFSNRQKNRSGQPDWSAFRVKANTVIKYYMQDGKEVLYKTVKGPVYREAFDDTDFARGLYIRSELISCKIKYPRQRIAFSIFYISFRCQSWRCRWVK